MKKSVLKIFLHGLGIYLKNFIPLSRAMLFPVFGQIAGIFLILGPVYFYRQLYLIKLSPPELQKNLLFILFGLIIMVIPGFAIFIKAFWDYMIVMVSLNTMVSDIIRAKPPTGFKIHNDAIKLRTKDYIILLFMLMGLWLVFLAVPFVLLAAASFVLSTTFSVAIFMLSMITCLALLGIISIYLCLSFQVFAFEALGPLRVIIKSYEMIENNFWRAVGLGLILFVLTGVVIPLVFEELTRFSPFMDYLVIPFMSYASILTQNMPVIGELSRYGLTLAMLAEETALIALGTTITMFILPFGSACFTLLYFDIKERKYS